MLHHVVFYNHIWPCRGCRSCAGKSQEGFYGARRGEGASLRLPRPSFMRFTKGKRQNMDGMLMSHSLRSSEECASSTR